VVECVEVDLLACQLPGDGFVGFGGAVGEVVEFLAIQVLPESEVMGVGFETQSFSVAFPKLVGKGAVEWDVIQLCILFRFFLYRTIATSTR
jgi:hypothetical protein